MKKILLLLILIPLLFNSCKKEEKSPANALNSQEVYSVLEINNSPEGIYNFWCMGDFTSIQVDSNNIIYTSNNWSLLLATGSPIAYQYRLDFIPENDTTGCADILIKTYHNNNLINTESFQIGFFNSTHPILFIATT